MQDGILSDGGGRRGLHNVQCTPGLFRHKAECDKTGGTGERELGMALWVTPIIITGHEKGMIHGSPWVPLIPPC